MADEFPDILGFPLPDEVRKAIEEILSEPGAKEELIRLGILKVIKGKGGEIRLGVNLSEGSLDYDPRYWHNIAPPEVIDVSRYFEYDEDTHLQLRKWLRLDERAPETIVEVGCKSGQFTEQIIKMAPPSKNIVAIEPDDVLREYAKEKLSSKVRFLKGAEDDIPLPDEFADLTVCHIVLNNLPGVHRVVSEMTRVTKCGGIVAAIEPSGGNIHYYPDPELNELSEKVFGAYAKGIWNLRSKLIDYSKDLKQKNARYAEVFHACGLINVEEHGILSAVLLSDPRRDRQDVLQWLKKRLFIHENDWKRVRTILQRGGLPESLTQEYYQALKTYLENLINHPDQISKTSELETAHRTVTIGFKPEKNSPV